MTNTTNARIAEALEKCAREPVHIPGAIQPAGCLICLDDGLTRILHFSANIESHLGLSVQQVRAATPASVLGSRFLSRLRLELDGHQRLPSALIENRRVGGQSRRFYVSAYRHEQRVVIELEPLGRPGERRLLSAVNAWLSRIADAGSTAALLQTVVDGVRALTGYERVMIYEFDSDWHGMVTAESRTSSADGYLGHRFPASDIPPQVRRIYEINPVRSIPDATAAPVALVPGRDPLEGGPLDLSQGMLRAVSPIHLAYLRNMGVGASLSVAIHSDVGLWGLVACHGLKPRKLSPAVRDAVRTVVQMATQRLFLLSARAESRYLQRVQDSRELISEERGRVKGPYELVQRHGHEWLELFRCCGVGVLYHDLVSRVGKLPSTSELKHIAGWLKRAHRHSGAWYSRSLSDTPLANIVALGDYAGLLAAPLPIDSGEPGWLLLFRAEQAMTHRWAGEPNDVAEIKDGELTLSPRRSFNTWLEEVRGHSEAWSPIEQRAALDLGEDLAVSVSHHDVDLLNSRLKEANQRLERLAHTDPLTQAWNRYRMELAIDAAISAAERYEGQCALLLFDIDHFKQINDSHGHEAGDNVLMTMAGELISDLRTCDNLGRWGGEEFIVLAPGTGMEDARELAERLRQRVASIDFDTVGQVTASVGIAAWQPGDTRRTLIARADRAMYRAKQAGRNGVVADVGPPV
ncbi:MAG: diguanylate cyclase [Aquisalimonadaceae bacterium]